MASQCPKCQGAIADDFGLINCPKCGASLFIEMDGNVRAYELGEVSDEPPEAINSTMKLAEEEPADEDLDGAIELQWDDDPPLADPPTFNAADIGPEVDPDDDDEDFSESKLDWGAVPEKREPPGLKAEEKTSAADKTTASDKTSAQDKTDMLTGQSLIPTVNFFQPKEGEDSPTVPLPQEQDEAGDLSFSEAPAPSDYVPPAAENLEDMSNLAKYGNSEESQGRAGPLRVKVRVAGIDSPEIREELRAALTDKKFLWDTEEMMRSIDRGVLVIPNATPLKAAILIERIKGMPLDISWEQFAITQP